MIYELVVTSVPRGLQAGRSGFTTVLRTRGIHPELGNRLEAASGYRHVYAQGDPRNPQIRSHTIVQTPVGQMCVLSRIIDAGNDYSGRSNKLAHHLAFDAADVAARAKSSPAAVLLAAERSGIFQRQWAGEPREQPAAPAAPNVPVEPGPCAAWARAAGDAGWAGFLVDRALKKEPTWIIAPLGVDLVELYAEALALVNYPQRWSISFTTYALTAGDALWLGTVDGSPEAQSARGQQRIAVVDLVRRPALTVQSPTIDAARGTGQVPWKRDMSRPAAAASVAPAAVTSAGLPPGQQVGPAIPVTGPVTLPPAIGGASGGPPRLGGPQGSPPPMHGSNPLGGPPPGGPWGTGAGDDLPSEPARGGGFGFKVFAAVGAGVLVAGLGATAWFNPEFGQRLVARVGGAAEEAKTVEPTKGDHVSPAASALDKFTDKGNPGGDQAAAATERPTKAGDGSNAAADSDKPIEAQPIPTPAAPPPPTPAEKWRAFQAERAKPGGRYPLGSLDGENAKEQRAKICEVDDIKDIEFDLLVPTKIFTPGIDAWQLACRRPEPNKKEWVFECVSWKQDSPGKKESSSLGRAYVADDDWLVVDLAAGDEKPIARAAREALACCPLTFKTTAKGVAADNSQDISYVQLLRPVEYGPIVIKDFFANKRIWPNGKAKDGKFAKGEFVAIPNAAVPVNPWLCKMTTAKKDATLIGPGNHKPRVAEVYENEGRFSSDAWDSGEIQIHWDASFTKANSLPFLRTDVEFQRLDDQDVPVLGIRVGRAAIDTKCITHDLLAHLNKAPALQHKEVGSDRLDVEEYLPLTNNKIDKFRDSQSEKVAFATMRKFIQAWLPVELFPTDQDRKKAADALLPNQNRQGMSLDKWSDELRDLLAKTDYYAKWCGHPGKPPTDPNDPSKQQEFNKQLAAWNQALVLCAENKKNKRMQTFAFSEWLKKEAKSQDEKMAVASLIALCTAIEKIPAVETGKRETLELLESMAAADLQITGSLVVWEDNSSAKQCVLATFTADKVPVVIEHEKADDKVKINKKNKLDKDNDTSPTDTAPPAKGTVNDTFSGTR